MRLTIIYDNETTNPALKPDWGFSCLVEAHGRRILFDTGAGGPILLDNMKELDIEPASIDEVFISHDHHDHTGGLADFLKLNPCTVYVPASRGEVPGAAETIKVKDPLEIHEGLVSTGELRNAEQSLVIKSDKGVVVVAGCSHPGVGSILDVAGRFGNIVALIGGLHGFSDFYLLGDLDLVCPTHCTQFKSQIKSLYPDKYIEGGAGVIIEI